VTAAASTGRELLERCRHERPDLIITDIKMPDLDGISMTETLERDGPVPVILLSAHHDADLIARAGTDHIMAYLIKPVSEADLKAAIPLAMQRFRQMQVLAEESAGLRQALEDRKMIEKAKGILMRRLRIEEEDAFRRLRMLASSQNRKVIEVGRQVIAADEVFHQLEQLGHGG